MVLGLRSKNRKGALVQVEYLIHLQEIKPWPPLESLKSARSLLLQWENGDHNSGFFTCNAGDGKLECSESFRLPVTLKMEASKKGSSQQVFQKNFLEFNLYENRKDKATKGQHIGSTVVNFADYGIIKDTITINCPISLKKNSKSAVQSILYVDIQAYERDNSSFSKEGSVDKDGNESVSEVTNEGNDDGSEIASFTDDDIDDDVSSHSSQNISSFASGTTKESTAQSEKNGSGSMNVSVSKVNGKPITSSDVVASNFEEDFAAVTFKHLSGIFSSVPSTYVQPNQQNLTNVIAAKVALSDENIQAGQNSTEATTSSLHVNVMEDKEDKDKQDDGWNGESLEVQNHVLEGKLGGNLPQDDARKKVRLRSNTLAMNRTTVGLQGGTRRDKLKHLKSVQTHYDSAENDGPISNIDVLEKARKIDVPANVHRESIRYALKAKDAKPQTLSSSKAESHSKIEILKEYNNAAASAEVSTVSAVADGNSRNMVQLMDKPKQLHHVEISWEGGDSQAPSESKTEGTCSKSTVELKTKVEMLEEELMEAAAVEVGLYSIIAEHGSSMSKVHAPARRLSRFYLHVCKAMSQAKRANAARAIISGLVLVSKACGNDVPRLTFWLSNAIVLRAIISQAVEKSQVAVEPSNNSNGHEKGLHKSFLLENDKNGEAKGVDALEEPQTYVAMLENVEAWIFSRIVESIWWQTLTPHMQSTAVKGSRKIHSSKRYGLGGQEQGNLAIELWKKAFRDACERLCPIRSAGHECGCLPFLPRLVMEQLVVRLDVAMFNAILRESDEEMPTDPVSDPISDLKVLPIPAGRLSFGAGVQLKNAVGSWSRWLTNLFGIDDNEPREYKDDYDKNEQRSETSFKAFHLLNALSDLMMLPFEMLADRSTRKEVCPTFGAPVIERVLYNFVPDEFNPDPIPDVVYESLDTEEHDEDGEESITTFPCIAAPITYFPPSAASLSPMLGEVGDQTLQRSGSVLLRKAYTSDDELDELDTPMTCVIIDKSWNSASPAAASSWIQFGKRDRKVVRYQLLREAWKDGE